MVKKLSDLYGMGSTFLEEECATGDVNFEFYEVPKPISESISLRGGKKIKKILGIAEGVFSVLDGTSRNNRFYPESFWKAVVLNEDMQRKISSRRMLGTIGHYDKKIDTEDFAKGLISHVITELRIDEANGVVWGKIEILDTDAGRKLKECYDSDLPMYISSRGAGKLQPSLNSNLMRVDEKYYYLEGYDIVWDPGFLQAKPVYKSIGDIDEDVNEEKLNSTIYDNGNNKNEEIIEMDKTLLDMSNIEMKAGLEGLIKELLAPLQEENSSLKGLLESLQLEIQESKEDFMKMIEKKKEEAKEKDVKEDDKKEDDKKETSEEKVDYSKVVEDLQSKLVLLEEKIASMEPKKEPEDAACEHASVAIPNETHTSASEEKEKEAKEKEEKEKEEIDESQKIIEDLKTQITSLEEEKKVSEEYQGEVKKLIESIREKTDKASVMAEEYTKNKEELDRVSEELAKATSELTARQVSEECGITIEDARVRLQDKSVEQIKEEVEKEKDEEKEAKEKEAKEKLEESISKSVSESNGETKQKPFKVKFIEKQVEDTSTKFISESDESSEEAPKQKPFKVKFIQK